MNAYLADRVIDLEKSVRHIVEALNAQAQLVSHHDHILNTAFATSDVFVGASSKHPSINVPESMKNALHEAGWCLITQEEWKAQQAELERLRGIVGKFKQWAKEGFR